MFKAVHIAADDWAHAAKVCAEKLSISDGDPYTLGFLYVSGALAADITSILTFLRQKTGIKHWTGSVATGICAQGGDGGIPGDYYDRSAVAVMVAQVPEDIFCTLPTLEKTGDIPVHISQWLAATQSHFGIVHGDPANGNIPSVIDELVERHTLFLAGGLTSSGGGINYQIADDVTSGGLSGVLFAPGLSVAAGLSQGCQPISRPHIITECTNNILMALDGRPALEVFSDDIGEDLANDMASVQGLVHVGIPIEGSDTGDFMVRTLIGIDVRRGWLAIGENVNMGEQVLFVRRDRASAEADFRAMLENLKERLSGPPKGGVYYSCIARGPSLFGAEGREIGMIREVIGDIPLVGFYGNGEISNSRLYGYTGVLVLFQ
ncbi:MAG: FIST C-terminal domain-containing protein [Rhodospirillaceae bacterium]|nr:FIST C-terminal domain-containing protein [Rhodospirillaceae bacterium]